MNSRIISDNTAMQIAKFIVQQDETNGAKVPKLKVFSVLGFDELLVDGCINELNHVVNKSGGVKISYDDLGRLRRYFESKLGNIQPGKYVRGGISDNKGLDIPIEVLQEQNKKEKGGTVTVLQDAIISDDLPTTAEQDLIINGGGGIQVTDVIRSNTVEFEKGGDLKKDMPFKGTPEWHQIKIAKETMRYNDVGAALLGGMSKEDAKKILDKYGIKYEEGGTVEENAFIGANTKIVVDGLYVRAVNGNEVLKEYKAGSVSELPGLANQLRYEFNIEKEPGYVTIWSRSGSNSPWVIERSHPVWYVYDLFKNITREGERVTINNREYAWFEGGKNPNKNEKHLVSYQIDPFVKEVTELHKLFAYDKNGLLYSKDFDKFGELASKIYNKYFQWHDDHHKRKQIFNNNVSKFVPRPAKEIIMKNIERYVSFKKEDTADIEKKAKGGIADKTPIIPEMIAERAVYEYVHIDNQERYNKLKGFDHSQIYSLKEQLVPVLVTRAEYLYGANNDFKKKVNAKGNRGRDYLSGMMLHWVGALVKRFPMPTLEKLGKAYEDVVGYDIVEDGEGLNDYHSVITIMKEYDELPENVAIMPFKNKGMYGYFTFDWRNKK